MAHLDSPEEIKELDKSQVLASIQKLPEQMGQAWKEVSQMVLPEDYGRVTNILVSGMGGSALGARIVKFLFSEKLRQPFEISNNFSLPNFVSGDDLIILNSYSGNTEETLDSAQDALDKGAKLFCVSTGGKLASFAQQLKVPHYEFKPTYNPSGQPRMGLGYSLAIFLALLKKLNLIELSEGEVIEGIEALRKISQTFAVETPQAQNPAKQIAEHLLGKIPVLVTSDHLAGIGHAIKNQMNENAKVFALAFDVPELNHHLMEGLAYPEAAKTLYNFLFIESNLYGEKVKLRYPVTQEVIAQNGIQAGKYRTQTTTKLSQALEVLALGAYVAFYLSMLEGIDPAPIPWVDFFKEKLS